MMQLMGISLYDHVYVFKIDWFTHGSRSDWKVRGAEEQATD